MPISKRPQYTRKNSTQTLREGLQEYYALNPHLTPPNQQPEEFARILLAHDVGHVIYGCDTSMFDELKILPLFWWTSECTFKKFLKMRNTPAVDVMYDDMIKEKGVFWLYVEVPRVILPLIPEVISIWLKTRNHRKLLPFLDFDPLLERSLMEIRQEFDILKLIKR